MLLLSGAMVYPMQPEWRRTVRNVWDRLTRTTADDKIERRAREVAREIVCKSMTLEQGIAHLIAFDIAIEGFVSPLTQSLAQIIGKTSVDPRLASCFAQSPEPA